MKRAHKLLTPYPSLRHDLACVDISRLVHDDLMKTLRPAYSDLQKSLRLFAAFGCYFLQTCTKIAQTVADVVFSKRHFLVSPPICRDLSR